jgi:hypothetical protein
VLRGKFRNVLILYGVVIVVMFAAIVLFTLAPEQMLRSFIYVFIILLAGQIFQLALQCYHWGGRLAISQPVTMDSWGLEFQGHQGALRLPWEAVPEVRQRLLLGQPLLTFVLHPQAMPGENGVEADPARWSRYQKKGLVLGGVGLIPGFETILPAIQHYSQGRTRIV